MAYIIQIIYFSLFLFSFFSSFLSASISDVNLSIVNCIFIFSLLLFCNILNKEFIIVYGELFGGFYPKDPESWINNRINNKGICTLPFEKRAIQEGIYYSENIEYIVFDVAFLQSDFNSESLTFYDYHEITSILEKTNFLYTRESLSKM